MIMRNDLCFCVVSSMGNYDFFNEKKLICSCGYESSTFSREKSPDCCPACSADAVDCELYFVVDYISHNVLAGEFYQNFYSFKCDEDGLRETSRFSAVFSYKDAFKISYKETHSYSKAGSLNCYSTDKICGDKKITRIINSFSHETFELKSSVINGCAKKSVDIRRDFKRGRILKNIDAYESMLFDDLPSFINAWAALVLEEYADYIITNKKSLKNLAYRYIDELNVRNMPYLKNIDAVLSIPHELFDITNKLQSFNEFCSFILNYSDQKSVKRTLYEAINEHELGLFEIDKFYVLSRVFKNIDRLHSLLSNKAVVLPKCSFSQSLTLIELLTVLVTNLGERKLYNRLLTEDFFGEFFYDTLRLFKNCDANDLAWSQIDFDTLDDIHYAILEISEYFKYIKDCENFQLEEFFYESWALNLVGEYEGFKFILPQSPKELFTWGRMHKNCLATRIDSVVRNKTIIVGVFKEEKHVLNAEISPNYGLIELRGYANKRASRVEAEIILDYLNYKKERCDLISA